MMTYNHEHFIAQAIEGVLSQKANFSFELVIGEDCSSDDTLKIVSFYADSYPKVIKLLTSNENKGAACNANRTLRQCSGKYVAFCEGDDYWTCPTKLAKQIEQLERNPECFLCCHNVLVESADSACLPYPYYHEIGEKVPPRFQDVKPPQISDLNRLLRGNFIQTPSIVMRNIFQDGLPDWFLGLGLGDWPMNVLAARQGKILYLDEIMAVYRIHRGGVWSRIEVEKKSDAVIKAAYAIRYNLPWSMSQKMILNAYICNMHLYSAERLGRAGLRWVAFQRVLRMFRDEGNLRPAYWVAFAYVLTRRFLPAGMVDRMFGLRRKMWRRLSQFTI